MKPASGNLCTNVSHTDTIKTTETTKEYDPEQLKKLQHLKIRIEVVGKATDYKKIRDLLKELSTFEIVALHTEDSLV